MSSNLAGLALEADPRNAEHPVTGAGNIPIETELIRAIHDPSISFEEYAYYAAITRAEEKEANERHVAATGPKTLKSVIMGRFSKGNEHVVNSPPESLSAGEKSGSDEKAVAPGSPPRRNLGNVSDAEWKNASRAVRTAGWGSAFYLITTDILGPFSVPYGPLGFIDCFQHTEHILQVGFRSNGLWPRYCSLHCLWWSCHVVSSIRHLN